MSCSGTSEDHCCYIRGKPCKYSEKDTVPGRKWACGLMRELQDWDLVITSDRYQKDVAPYFDPLGINCKDWPDANHIYCGSCGIQF